MLMEPVDSIANSSGFIKTCLDFFGGPSTITYGFFLSVFLLVFISLLKLLISHNEEKVDWWVMISELPIDICVIIITMVATSYMISVSESSSASDRIGVSAFLILVSLIIATICCYIRRTSIKISEDETKGCGWLIFWGCLNLCIGFGWSYCVIDFVANNG